MHQRQNSTTFQHQQVLEGQQCEKREKQLLEVLTGFAEEVDGVGQLRFLQLQLTLLNELKHFTVPKNGEFWGNAGPLLQKLPLQLHIAVWNQLTHHRLTLDLGGKDGVGTRKEGGVKWFPLLP